MAVGSRGASSCSAPSSATARFLCAYDRTLVMQLSIARQLMKSTSRAAPRAAMTGRSVSQAFSVAAGRRGSQPWERDSRQAGSSLPVVGWVKTAITGRAINPDPVGEFKPDQVESKPDIHALLDGDPCLEYASVRKRDLFKVISQRSREQDHSLATQAGELITPETIPRVVWFGDPSIEPCLDEGPALRGCYLQ